MYVTFPKINKQLLYAYKQQTFHIKIISIYYENLKCSVIIYFTCVLFVYVFSLH